jgi:hypothetical protein
MAPLLPIL